MKKVLLSLAAMAMMGMMMTSCQKNEGLSKETFTATTENGSSKTHLDGLNLKWDDRGESIMVMGSNYQRAEYVATSVTNDGTCATFACQEGEEVDADAYQIYYPATMVTANGMLELPAEQEYAENNVKGFPMYAETQSHAFQFTNLCGLFRLQLQKDDVVVRSITITTDKGVNGAFAVSTSAEGAFQFEAYTANDDAEKSVTLDCGNGVSIDELTDFNIYLPAGTYSTFDITITATDGTQCVKSLNGNAITINRNERVTLTREGDELEFVTPANFIDGRFTIDDQGTQVYFSKGNLDYNGSYFFAENQYDYGGYFGWGTGNNPTLTSDNPNDYAAYNEWGNHVDGGWYTLDYSQWSYVLGRCNWSLCGTATVCGVHGFILLPDAWDFTTMPFNAGCSYFQSGWDANEYDATTTPTWTQMEAAGAVFLPAAGNRFGTTMYNVGNSGHYWTSSLYNMAGYASDAGFDETDAYFSHNLKCFGNSVRLVKNAE